MLRLVTKYATVNVLSEGYAKTGEGPAGRMKANATCTLVQTENSLVIVDTMTPWDKDFLLQQLDLLKVNPADVTHVISTHGHSDHCGNNNLFLNAQKHIVGFCVSYKDEYISHPFDMGDPLIIDEYLKVIPTPGHTSEDVTLIVRLREPEVPHENNTHATLAIAGDLFECEEDLLDPQIWTVNSHNPRQQAENRLKVMRLANHIIPGHGQSFQIEPKHLAAAEELYRNYQRNYPNGY